MNHSEPSSHKHFGRKHWLILAVLIIIILAIIWFWQFKDKKPEQTISKQNSGQTQAKAALTVTVIQPIRQNWQQKLTANGNIAAWQEVVIGSELSGQRITQVYVNIGDQVKRGQVLAEINSDSIRAELATAKANYKEAQAVLHDAVINNQRIQQLRNTGAISAQESTQYQTSQNTAQARLEASDAQIKSNELRLAQTRVIAPDNGVISARSATVGSLAQTGQELFRLIRDHRLEWRAEVTTTDLYLFKQGMKAKIISPDPNQDAITGTVRMIAPIIDPQTRYGLVYVDLPLTQAVRMGMFVKGEFELGEKSALTVPQSALLLRDGFSYVFIVQENHRVKQQKVSVGRRQNDLVEILDLAENVKIVSSGTGFLADGDLVSVAANIPDTPLSQKLVTQQEN